MTEGRRRGRRGGGRREGCRGGGGVKEEGKEGEEEEFLSRVCGWWGLTSIKLAQM